MLSGAVGVLCGVLIPPRRIEAAATENATSPIAIVANWTVKATLGVVVRFRPRGAADALDEIRGRVLSIGTIRAVRYLVMISSVDLPVVGIDCAGWAVLAGRLSILGLYLALHAHCAGNSDVTCLVRSGRPRQAVSALSSGRTRVQGNEGTCWALAVALRTCRRAVRRVRAIQAVTLLVVLAGERAVAVLAGVTGAVAQLGAWKH